jgi:hypothetical protein
MTNFTNENILKDGNSIYYAPDGWNTPWSERMFLGRFKYSTSPFTMGKFKAQLKKRFTVEAYAAKRELGLAPLEILKEDDPVWYDKIVYKFKEKRSNY